MINAFSRWWEKVRGHLRALLTCFQASTVVVLVVVGCLHSRYLLLHKPYSVAKSLSFPTRTNIEQPIENFRNGPRLNTNATLRTSVSQP